MITNQEVHTNANKWLIQQYETKKSYCEKYVVDTRSWYVKLLQYIKEII